MSDLDPIILSLDDEEATNALARKLARDARPGDVVALSGGLGVGKTAFARAFVRARCGSGEEVPSPTFTLVQLYECDTLTIWHFDLYRLESTGEVLELGIEEAFADGVALVEWPDRLGPYLPRERLDILLGHGRGEHQRRAVLSANGAAWAARLRGLAGSE